MNTTQLTLGLNLRDDATFSNFYCVEKNRLMLMSLHASAIGRGEPFIYIWGPKGTGRSHLLQASCHAGHQVGLTTLYLPLNDVHALKPEILEGLEALHLICVDDIQNIAGKKEWEVAFFDFFNRMQEAHKRLIIAANLQPQSLNMALKDLVSRLTSGTTYPICELSDEQKIEALILRAKARGMLLKEDVAKFLFRRFPRDMSSLFGALDVLDKTSIEAQRRLTIPFVKEVLKI